MKHIDENLLAQFRSRGRCDVCGVWCAMREGHHIIPKGMGGGSRMDVRENLLCVGATLPFPECGCHERCQRRKVSLEEQCSIVAKREGLRSGAVVLARLYLLRRLPKESKLPKWVRRTG